MKLIFPNGEHAPVALDEGVTRVGSAADCSLVLTAPGVAAHHCEIETRGGQTTLRSVDDTAPTVLNGRQITQEMPLKPGDLVLFGRIGCRVSSDRPVAATMPPPPVKKSGSEDARTRVRNTLPKFMLRGVSGATFGKTFALTGTMVIGRQNDSDIPVPAEEISRHHARLQVTAEGVMVEDMGSANGTFINDKRVQTGLLKPGEELRLDTVRFMLVAPGMDARQQSAARAETAKPAAASAPQGSGKAIGI
ncbi:MAG TPA: FHA domain-containing protein, partial [Rhodanobacteraceae bacterium]|nr:FHA domain-containing protein [Rhodanobacteraceae bacterium]